MNTLIEMDYLLGKKNNTEGLFINNDAVAYCL